MCQTHNIVLSTCSQSLCTIEMISTHDIMEKAGTSLFIADVFFLLSYAKCLCRLDLCSFTRTCKQFRQEHGTKVRKPTQTTCWNCEGYKPRDKKKLCGACRRMWDPEISHGMAYAAGFPIIALKLSPWTRRPGGIKAYKIHVLRLFCLECECECYHEINKRFERRRALGRTLIQLFQRESSASASFDLRVYLKFFLL
jgi:hypothetical protein